MAGADPSFTEVHVLRTLYLLHSRRTGRKRLVKLIGLGEGSVRTIIKRLSLSGLVASSKQGHELTESGARLAEEILKKISKPVAFDSSGLVCGCQSLVIVRGAAGMVGDGVALRDVALRAGAAGAVVLVHDGRISLPGGFMDLDRYALANKLGGLPIRESDAVVIGFGPTQHKAEDGAVATALRLAGVARLEVFN